MPEPFNRVLDMGQSAGYTDVPGESCMRTGCFFDSHEEMIERAKVAACAVLYWEGNVADVVALARADADIVIAQRADAGDSVTRVNDFRIAPRKLDLTMQLRGLTGLLIQPIPKNDRYRCEPGSSDAVSSNEEIAIVIPRNNGPSGTGYRI